MTGSHFPYSAVVRSPLGVDVGYYRVFENTLTGPFQTMVGPAPNTSVSSTMSEQSILLGVTFSPVGGR